MNLAGTGNTARRAATPTLGFKIHTGWAIAVGVLSRGASFEILLRRRIELLPHEDDGHRFIYHRASELPAEEAERSIRRARTDARKASTSAVRELVQAMKALGHPVKRAGVPASRRTAPEDLSAVLRSHPFIHTAEAIFYQQVLAEACVQCDLTVVATCQRDALFLAASQRHLSEGELEKKIAGMRRAVGAPWGADHKSAMALALVASGSGAEPAAPRSTGKTAS